MTVSLEISGTIYECIFDAPLDISIPLDFHGEQPNAFYLPRATAQYVEDGGFVGDTRHGGSCNCENLTINPHGNGTHTECIGHISKQRIAVAQAVREVLVPCVVMSVDMSYVDDAGDHGVTRPMLERAVQQLGDVPDVFFQALIIRSLPNHPSKKTRQYSGTLPPYLSLDAIDYIRSLGTEHLLVDLPSVDREDDPHLVGHHRFFGFVSDDVPIADENLSRTITEMIFVDDAIADGCYVLNLQIPPFVLDAAPSRPMLLAMNS